VRSLRINELTGATEISLESAEALLQDLVQLDGGLPFGPGPWPLLLGEFGLLGFIGSDLTSYPPELDTSSAEWLWLDGQAGWDGPEAALQLAGLRLYADEGSDWYLVGNPHNRDDLIRLSAISDLSTEIVLDTPEDSAFHDAVVVIYMWTDDDGFSYRVSDVAHAPVWSKALTVTYNDTPYPGPGAAAKILARQLELGLSKTVTVSSDYSARPGMWVAIRDTHAGRIRSVLFDLATGQMTIQTRAVVPLAASSWLLDTPGVSWADIPAGTDWTEDL
jgi:hypothetical protein